jgi:hypothetical protein
MQSTELVAVHSAHTYLTLFLILLYYLLNLAGKDEAVSCTCHVTVLPMVAPARVHFFDAQFLVFYYIFLLLRVPFLLLLVFPSPQMRLFAALATSLCLSPPLPLIVTILQITTSM